MSDESLGLLGSDAFVEVVVDEADRGRPAGCQALGVFDRVVPARGDGNRVFVSIGGTAIDSGEFAKPGHEFVGSSHGTREGTADPEVELAGSFLAEAGIEGDDFHDLDRGDVEFLGNPFNGLRTDETVPVLDFVQEGKNSRTSLVIGILGDALVSCLFQRWSDLERREVNRAGSDRRVNVLLENAWLRTTVFHRTPVDLRRLWRFAQFRGVETDVAQLGPVDRAGAGDFNFRTHLKKKIRLKN